MHEVYLNRLVFFARLIVAVWLISLIYFLHKLDSYNLRDEVNDLYFLSIVEDINDVKELTDEQPTLMNIQSWLDERKGISEGRISSRETIIEWLKPFVGSEILANVTGKHFGDGRKKIPFYLFSVSTQDNSGELCSNLSNTDAIYPDVASVICKLVLLSRPTLITVVTGIDEESLPSLSFPVPEDCLPGLRAPTASEDSGTEVPGAILPDLHEETPQSLREQPSREWPGTTNQDLPPGLPQDSGRVPGSVSSEGPKSGNEKFCDLNDIWKYRSTKLEASTIKVNFSEDYGNSPVQWAPSVRLFEIDAKTETLTGESLVYYSNPDRPRNEELLRLADNTRRLEFLRVSYGYLPIHEAKKIAIDGLKQAYTSISILGINFSVRLFPFAVLFFSLVGMIGTAITIRESIKRNVKIVFGTSTENAYSMLVNNGVSRFVVWILLPPLSILTSFPPIPINPVLNFILFSGVAVLLSIGIASFFYYKTQNTKVSSPQK